MGIVKRNNIWMSNWRHEGKQYRFSTGLPIDGNRDKGGALTAAASAKAAERIATALIDCSRGEITYKQALAALDAIPNLPPRVRDAAKDKARSLAVVNGVDNMPSVRDYLTNFKGDAKPQSESNRQNYFKKFLTFLGNDGDRRLDAVTPEMCRAFVRDGLESSVHGVSVGTMESAKKYISAAFNRAVQDSLLTVNPFRGISPRKIGEAVNPELGEDKNERLPFTADEMRMLCTVIAQPWRDMVLISFLTGGQRLGDVACLRWESINFEAGIISFATGKTKTAISVMMPPPLRACLERLIQERMSDEYVFPDMADTYRRSGGYLSTKFTAMLCALGINADTSKTPLKGKRKKQAAKSFHSIRHTVVTMLRSSNAVSADVARAIVGHNSEEVERQYMTASHEVKSVGLALLASEIGLAST